MITITLEGEPRGKGRPRHGNGFTYTPAATRAYETALGFKARVGMAGHPLFDEPLHVTLLAQMPIPTSWSQKKQHAAIRGELRPTGKPDLDNIMKMLDALNGIVWRDDSLVVIATLEKRYSVCPALIVTIRKLPGQPEPTGL